MYPHLICLFSAIYVSVWKTMCVVWDVLVAYLDTFFFFSNVTHHTVIRNNHMSLYRPYLYHFPKCLFKLSGNPFKDLEDKNNGAFMPV